MFTASVLLVSLATGRQPTVSLQDRRVNVLVPGPRRGVLTTSELDLAELFSTLWRVGARKFETMQRSNPAT